MVLRQVLHTNWKWSYLFSIFAESVCYEGKDDNEEDDTADDGDGEHSLCSLHIVGLDLSHYGHHQDQQQQQLDLEFFLSIFRHL